MSNFISRECKLVMLLLCTVASSSIDPQQMGDRDIMVELL
jgi:hypothetical protein